MANPGIFPGAVALMPQQRERTESDWAPRDYWVQPPTRIPPKPLFEAWVPPAESISFGELPRDLSRYQVQGQALPFTQVLPVPPKSKDQAPQQNVRPDWTLRDYAVNQDRFSILATPLQPPPNNQLPPLHNARPDWTLRDYAAFQPTGAWFENRATLNVIPPNDGYVFGELPRDMTALTLVLAPRATAISAAIGVPKPQLRLAEFAIRPYDLTAHYLVLTTSVAQAGIPQVPLGGSFAGFDYEPIDLTPYQLAFAVKVIAAAPGAQIPPSAIPFIEWPGWQQGQYQANQDQFSALATPPTHAYPPGLLPLFTPEAFIRDVSHPTTLQTVQTFILPPPPPRVIPTPPTFIEWRQWTFSEYPYYQDQFSAWASLVLPVAAFLVQAVTSGWYNGLYLYPGDVFLLNKASDFSDSSVDYSGGKAATPQYGWMRKVPAGTPVFYTETGVWPPNFPVIDPVPPKRFVF